MIILRRGLRSGEFQARILTDRGVITVPASHDNFVGATKLKIDNLDDYWLTYSQRNSHTWISFQSDTSSENRSIGVMTLLGCNRGPFLAPEGALDENSSNLFRIMVDENPLSNRIRPEITSFSKTNLTGVQSAIEGPVHPPSAPVSPSYAHTRLTATNPALNTVLTVGYANHFASERPLTGTQLFYLHIRDSLNAGSWVNVSVVLVQSGVDILTLGTIIDPELTSEGLLFTYDFDASVLPSSTAAISFRITGTTTGASAPEPIGVSWVANLGNLNYDSGWLPGSRYVGALPNVDLDPFATLYAQIEWSDYVSLQGTPTISGNIVNVFEDVGGLFFAGKLAGGEGRFVPLASEDGYSQHKTQGPNNASRVYQGGLRSPRNAATWWEADVVVCAQKQSDIFGYLEDQFNALGLMTLCTLFIPDPEDLSTALWACLSAWEAPHKGMFSGTDDDGLQYSNEHMYELNFSIVEKTGRRTTGG